MGLDSVLVQIAQQDGRYLVIQHALSYEAGPLDIVIGHRDIRVAEDHLMRVVRCENLFLVAFEDEFSLLHYALVLRK